MSLRARQNGGGKIRNAGGRGGGNGSPGGRGNSGGGGGSTWSTTRLGSDVTLSNGNLTATTASQAGDWAQTDSIKSSGKLYFEILVTQSTTNWLWLGICEQNTAYENNGSPGSIPTMMLRSGTWSTGGGTGTPPTITSGDILGFAVDFTATTVAVYKNGSLTTTSASFGGGSVRIGAMNGFLTSTNIFTLRTTNAEFTYSPPSGFTAWGS